LTKRVWQVVNVIVGVGIVLFLIGKLTIAKNLENEDQNVYEKMADGGSIDYLIVGDSIGRGSGAETPDLTWFSQLEEMISSKYDATLKRSSIVQSGATAFEGILKLENEMPAKAIDIAFIVFGENDRKYMNPEQFSYYYEVLIRKIKKTNPQAEIITITESCLNEQAFASEIKRVSEYYNAVNIDMRRPFAASGLTAEQLTRDLIHPNGKGYRLYANEIKNVLQANMLHSKAITVLFPDPIHLEADLNFRTETDVIQNNGFAFSTPYFVSEKKNDSLEYEFTGSSVGVKVLHTAQGGLVEVYIDEKYTTTISTWWPFERERHLFIAGGLRSDFHKINFVSTGESSHPQASGNPTIQIAGIIISDIDH
jgi:lysophospholipase L1-like esterase